MTTNQKIVRLLDQIINGSKGYCGDHFVYTPQLREDVVNELRAELISPPIKKGGHEESKMTWNGIERRSWMSRFLDRVRLVLVVIGILFFAGGVAGVFVLWFGG